MKFPDLVSKLPLFKKGNASKFFLIAVPVILHALSELAILIMVSNGVIKLSYRMAFLLVFLLTIVAVAGVLYLYNRLVSPLRLAKQALSNYVVSQEIPQLPTRTGDEASLLLSNIHATITQLDALIVEKTDMIDLLSHDMRSPVARIIGFCDLLKDCGEAERVEYADSIVSECRGLLRMMENILIMLKEDNQVFTLANINLKKLVTEVADFFSFSIVGKNIALEVDIDDTIYIHVQPDLFTQALRNLVGNAVKFSPDDKAIYISAREENNQISLCIRDEGLGLEPEDITKIFDRFTSAGKKGTHGEASVGLGLYLSRKIIEKHDGKLVAESDGINKGASFTIYLHQLVTKKPQVRMLKNPELSPKEQPKQALTLA